MGKARDGSNCYTRQNKAGGKYITCEGKQKADRKLQREISKLHGRQRKKVTKSEFNEARAGLQQTLSNVVVAERPGVVGMTSTMSPLGQATFDALLDAGQDVSRGISAAVAERNKVSFYDIVFRGKIGDTNAFDIQDAYDTAKGSWFHTNEGLSGNLTKAQVDDMKKRYPDISISQPEMPPPIPETPLSLAFGKFL